ncbi:MAG: ATP-binding protein [Planctomycetaceae bacterium]|jgi:hypothetical protein|nr:ATP-binding protein [Planctomycetaceae bacterium]
MKVTIKNLGVLESAEYELGNLTVVCGKNNTGKTYAAYALYGFLDYWRNGYDFQVDSVLQDEFQNNGEVLINEKQVRNFLQKNLERAYKKYSGERLPEALGYSSDSFKRQFNDCDFCVEIDQKNISPLFDVNLQKRFRGIYNGAKLPIKVDVDRDNIRISHVYPQTVQKIYFNSMISPFISREIIPYASFASADRIGAAMFSDEIRYLRDEFYQKKESALIKTIPVDYPIPVTKNLNAIRDSLLSPPQLSEDIQQIFCELLGGKFEITNGKLFFVPLNSAGDLSLSVMASSSSVRSLLSLWLQLCKETQTLHLPNMFMIDEPEMNLHPASQRLLARIFARLVNLGYKIYITTHSDYIVKELNTLIMLNRRNKNNKDIIEQYGYSEKEFLDPANVRVYMTQESQTKNKNIKKITTKNNKKFFMPKYKFIQAKIDEFGIDLPSFDETIDEMNKIQIELLAGDDNE